MRKMSAIDWLLNRIGLQKKSYVQMYGGGMAGDFRSDAYQNAVARAAADVIARQAAKFKARHVTDQGGDRQDELAQILTLRPNPLMSAYDLQYKLVMQAMLKNNGFALAVWNRTKLMGLLPIDYTSCQVVQDSTGGDLFLDFALTNGKQLVVDYDDIIHIRRFFYKNRVLGDDNGPLGDAVALNNVLNAGVMTAVKSGSTIRGLLKFQKKAINRTELVKRRDEFVEDYMDSANSSGIAGIDADMEYIPIDPGKLYRVDAEQLKEVRGGIYRYFGISDAIADGKFNEDEWNAFYESILEPLSIQLSMECTHKLLSAQQRNRGEKIMFEANRLQYASARTKIELVKELGSLGMITIDEGREIFNLGPTEGGDKRLVSLNYTEAANMAEYQVGHRDKAQEGEKRGPFAPR